MGIFAQVAEQQKTGGVFAQANASTPKGAFGGKPTNSFTSANIAKVPGQVVSPIKETWKSGIDQASDAIVESQNGKNPIETGAKFFGGAATAFAAPVAPLFALPGKVISTVAKTIGDKVSDIPAVQKFALGKGGEALQRGTELVNNLNTGLGVVAGFESPKAVADIPETPMKPFPTKPVAVETPSITKHTKAVDSLMKEWEQPVKQPTATFNKAKDVLAKDPSTPKFLAEQGIDPRAHIEDGRYVTEETAQSLRDTAGKMSADTLRPSLKAAEYSTPPVPMSEIQANAIKRVSSDKSITAGDKSAIISRINKEAEALKATYPNGVKLTDMHDNKITYAKNGGYSPIKSASDNNIATANRLLGQAFEEVGTAKTPAGVPVREFRAYLQKYYRAADYLDALNTKKAPVTLKQSLARATAKYGGAAIGSAFGGNVVSAFAGYSIGKAIEHALENMSNPMRAEFVRNIQITNPEAYTAVQAYLHKTSTGGGKLPLLKAADANSPIPLGPSTVKGPTVAPFAEKAGYPLPRNPQTGQIGTQYLSGPKVQGAIPKTKIGGVPAQKAGTSGGFAGGTLRNGPDSLVKTLKREELRDIITGHIKQDRPDLINADGTVTLYHGTPHADAIQKSGAFKAGTYFAADRSLVEKNYSGQSASKAGKFSILELKADPADLDYKGDGVFTARTGEIKAPSPSLPKGKSTLK